MSHVRACVASVALAAVVGTSCIVATYSRLSHTWDEPTHVAAGLEVLQYGRYTYQTENPPLSRLTIAVWPWLAGARVPEVNGALVLSPFAAGDGIFQRNPNSIRNVTQARVGTLPWYWACIALTWVLAGGRRDPLVAAAAATAVATVPPIVGHAGYATTDIPFVAVFLAVLLAWRRFLERPEWTRAVWVGLALGAAIATKFSSLMFLPPVVMAISAAQYWSSRREWLPTVVRPASLRLLAIVTVVTLVTLWGSYGFRVGRMTDLPRVFGSYGTFPTSGWPAVVGQWPIPAHEFVHGLLFLKAHTAAGHRSLMFGEFSQRGFIYYYPVVLAVKTPLPFILFVLFGCGALLRRRLIPSAPWFRGLAIGAVGLLAVAMTSPINIGVRHVIVLYPLLAMAAAYGWVRWSESSRYRRAIAAVGAGLIAAQAVLLVNAVPYQSAYYNALAGPEPASISSDSDFDWGQDGLALETYFKAHPVPELQLQLQGTVNPCKLQLPPFRALGRQPDAGWIAVSERIYQLNRVGRADPCSLTAGPASQPIGWLDWLKPLKPVAIIGKTIRLYHVSERDLPAMVDAHQAPK
jgi:hypothetical protein